MENLEFNWTSDFFLRMQILQNMLQMYHNMHTMLMIIYRG